MTVQSRAADYTGTINGANPPTFLQGGDTVTVNGASVRALNATGSPNAIVVQNGGVTLTATNSGAIGVATAQSGGRIDLGTGTIINVSGSGQSSGTMGPTGILSYRAGAYVTGRDVTVNASGDKPYGVYAFGGAIELSGLTTVNLAANSLTETAFGLVSRGNILTVEDTSITLTGYNGSLVDEADLIFAMDNGGVTTITGTATVNARGKMVYTVITWGSAASPGAIVNVNDINAKVVGENNGRGEGVGLYAEYGFINITGKADFDIVSDGFGAAIHMIDPAVVRLTGESYFSVAAPVAYGISMISPGDTVEASNITLDIVGTTAAAVLNNAVNEPNSSNRVAIVNGRLNSNLDGIVVAGGRLDVSLADTVMTNASGIAFKAGPSANGAYDGDLELTASASVFTGAATVAAGSTSNITLHDGSLWTVTGDSTLTSLANNGSMVAFSAPVGGMFKTMTVANYSGNEGMLVLNTELGTDGSPSDRLVIDGGTATGTTRLMIVNAGGPGAETFADGILVVDAVNGATTAADAFVQAGRIAAGAYDYTLVRGGSTSSDNWYLTSAYIPPGDDTPSPEPNYRPEASLAASLPPLAQEYGYAMLGTLHERIGEGAPAPQTQVYEERTVWCKSAELGYRCIARTPVVADGRTRWASSGWARLIGDRGFRDSSNFERHGPKYDYTFGGVQLGLDVFGREQGGSTDVAGLYAGYGTISADVKGAYGGKAGSVDMDAYSLGGYWTHKAERGWYTDAVVQGTWYATDATSVYGEKLKPDGFGFIASLEGGYAMALGHGIVLEPQAQLAYQTISFDEVADAYGRFRFDNEDSLRARVGARMSRTWNTTADATNHLITTWLRVNVWHEFLGDSKTVVTDIKGLNGVAIPSNLGGTWGEVGAGVTGQISPGIALFATGAYSHSLDNKGHEAWNGRLGAAVRW